MASVAINVLDPEFYVDPWRAYRWLRDEAPVWRDPVQQVWAVSRYDDLHPCLRPHPHHLHPSRPGR